MIFNCRRCGDHGELRKGKVTGNNAAKYRQLEAEINACLILGLKNTSYGKRLCLSCLEELSIWIANNTAHVRVVNAVKRVKSAAPNSSITRG